MLIKDWMTKEPLVILPQTSDRDNRQRHARESRAPPPSEKLPS